MKRFGLLFLLLSVFFAAAPLTAGAAQPRFTTIVVKQFTNASGMNQPQEFIQEFGEGIREALQRAKIADHIGDEGASVDDAMAASSLVVEGRFTSLNKGSFSTKLSMEIDMYRISDHVLVKAISTHVSYPNFGIRPDYLGVGLQRELASALKEINLSSIPVGPPIPRSAPAATASAPQPAAPLAFTSIQFSSIPVGAEITIDGSYAGNTPSLIKLRPGTHSIKIAKDGYAPWERTIESGAAEARTVSASLEKTGQ